MGGEFINYSLNTAQLIKFIYKIAGRNYHIEGPTDAFYLARASKEQKQIVETIFTTKVISRFTEILFHPDLKYSLSGKESSIIGKVDARLGGSNFLLGWIARQHSFKVQKL